LQRLLDTLEHSPAFIRTATWDVIAWNRAAAAVLTDYSTLPEGQRNVLRMMFRDLRVRAAQFIASLHLSSLQCAKTSTISDEPPRQHLAFAHGAEIFSYRQRHNRIFESVRAT
jgi:hypothetical protein